MICRFDNHAISVLLAFSPPALISPLYLTVVPSENAESMLLVVAILSFIGFAISECELPETMHHVLKKLSSISAAISPDLPSYTLNLVASPLPNEDWAIRPQLTTNTFLLATFEVSLIARAVFPLLCPLAILHVINPLALVTATRSYTEVNTVSMGSVMDPLPFVHITWWMSESTVGAMGSIEWPRSCVRCSVWIMKSSWCSMSKTSHPRTLIGSSRRPICMLFYIWWCLRRELLCLWDRFPEFLLCEILSLVALILFKQLCSYRLLYFGLYVPMSLPPCTEPWLYFDASFNISVHGRERPFHLAGAKPNGYVAERPPEAPPGLLPLLTALSYFLVTSAFIPVFEVTPGWHP